MTPSSSASRALLLGLAALILTAGGFYLGRRLSAPAAVPAALAPASPGPDDAMLAPAPADTESTEPGGEPGSPEDSRAAVEGAAPEPGAAAGRRSATPGRGVPQRERGGPSALRPTAAPGATEPDAGGPLPRAGAHAGFVAGLTQIGSTRSSGAELKGFDPSAVAVKRAPESDGAIEFEVVPSQVAPGQAYTVKVYLRNRCAKPIRIKGLTIASEMNGRRSRGEQSPRAKEVAPSLVGLLAELPGIWKEDVASWSLEVQVLTSSGDTYLNRMAWK